jgi:hypothetical protein
MRGLRIQQVLLDGGPEGHVRNEAVVVGVPPCLVAADKLAGVGFDVTVLGRYLGESRALRRALVQKDSQTGYLGEDLQCLLLLIRRHVRRHHGPVGRGNAGFQRLVGLGNALGDELKVVRFLCCVLWQVRLLGHGRLDDVRVLLRADLVDATDATQCSPSALVLGRLGLGSSLLVGFSEKDRDERFGGQVDDVGETTDSHRGAFEAVVGQLAEEGSSRVAVAGVVHAQRENLLLNAVALEHFRQGFSEELSCVRAVEVDELQRQTAQFGGLPLVVAHDDAQKRDHL